TIRNAAAGSPRNSRVATSGRPEASSFPGSGNAKTARPASSRDAKTTRVASSGNAEGSCIASSRNAKASWSSSSRGTQTSADGRPAAPSDTSAAHHDRSLEQHPVEGSDADENERWFRASHTGLPESHSGRTASVTVSNSEGLQGDWRGSQTSVQSLI